MEPALEEQRAALEMTMGDYVANQYYDDTAHCSVYAKAGMLTVVLNSRPRTQRNFAPRCKRAVDSSHRGTRG